MGKKGKKKGGGFGGDDVKADQPLQAVLFADSFSETFRPISFEQPKVLLPLVNVPMISYTLEFLATNGVEEVFVFCSSHADKVEAYLRESGWLASDAGGDGEGGEGGGGDGGGAGGDRAARPGHPLVRVVKSKRCTSAGDALRELDREGHIRSDPFVLVSGDVITNIDLASVIKEHEAARKKDK